MHRRASIALSLGLGAACTPPDPDDGPAALPMTTGATQGETTEARAPSSTDGRDLPADDDSGPAPADTTAGSDEGGSTGAPGCAPRPDPDPAWITPQQEDIVARLTGAAELSPGVVLSDRAAQDRRQAAAEYLLAELDAAGLDGQLHEYSDTGANVYAVVPATVETDQTVVVGAHFDTVPGSPGANDNATGVAMVLSLGRHLVELECRELNVVLVLFDQEEIGLVGSFNFASWLTEQPMTVLAVHTIDQMGWDADGDRTIELERADPGLFEFYEQAEVTAPVMVPLIPTRTGFTDHVSFREFGFDAVGLTEEFVSGDTTPHYHLPSDTFDTVDLAYLRSTTVLLHEAIASQVSPDL